MGIINSRRVWIGGLLGFVAWATWATFSRVFPLWWLLELWVGAILATFVAAWYYREN